MTRQTKKGAAHRSLIFKNKNVGMLFYRYISSFLQLSIFENMIQNNAEFD